MEILNRNDFLNSAVMICILKYNGEDFMILEKRAKNIRQEGEISFPGGKKEDGDPTYLDAAIRETIEELGIRRENMHSVEKFGVYISSIGVLLEVYTCEIRIDKIEDIKYNESEVEKLLLVPISYFIENEPIMEEAEFYSKIRFDINKYNIPKKYEGSIPISGRNLYFYEYDNEAIWGMTSEVILDFINKLKKNGKVGSYVYEKR